MAAATSSTSGNADQRILVGFVGRPHGVRGEVNVEVLSDVADRFAVGSVLRLVPKPRADRQAARPTVREHDVEVASSRPHRGVVLVRFHGIDDREQAAALTGSRLEVDPADVPPPPDGLYYHYQLIGCACHDRQAGLLGQVVDVVEDGGGDMLLVADGSRRLPVPFVRAFLVEVDVDAKRIDLDLPDGLIETCTSKS